MGAIEILFYTVVVIFACIGMVRGSNRELGNSIIFMYLVAVLGFAEERGWSRRAIEQIALLFGADTARINEVVFVAIVLVFVLIIVLTYQGKTFDFSNNRITGGVGLLAGFAVGALNGYLIAGALWHYADSYAYPFNLLMGSLTTTGNFLLDMLPQTIFPSAFYWAIPATILLIVRVAR